MANEIEQLRARLTEALEALEAIRYGGVDALVIYQEGGEKVYTLEGADEPYRVLVEAMNEGAATLSADGLILWGNTYLAGMLVQPLETILGSPIRDYIAPEERDVFDAVLSTAQRKQMKFETELLTKDDKHIPVLISISPFISEAHSANYSVVITDLSEQKRNEEILAAERMASAIIEQAAESIVVCDGEGIVLRASQTACRLAGQNPIFQPFEHVFPLKLSPDSHFSIRAVLDGQVFSSLEANLERSTPGTETELFHLLVSATPLQVSADQVIGCVITLTDQTERKRNEEEIRRYTVQLERSNRDLQEFAFIASHDLQEPLRKIKQFGEQLVRRIDPDLDESSRDALHRMIGAAERMQIMIQDLLELSRINTHGSAFGLVDLTQMASDVISDLDAQIQREHGKVRVADLPQIEADPVQMRQLLQNLIGNALKYHKPHIPPEIVVTCETDDRKTAKIPNIILVVTDNGIGFDHDEAERIFLPFQRLHGRSSEYQGTGMGLAICKKIVERHGGNIRAESKPGEGAKFIVTLPMKRALGKGE